MQRLGDAERLMARRILDGWSRDAKNDTRDLRHRRWCQHRPHRSRATPFNSDCYPALWR